MEISLSPDQAVHGGRFGLDLVFQVPCPGCGSSGGNEQFFCPICSGRGSYQMHERIFIRVPPNVEDGHILSLPVTLSNELQIQLNLILRVGSY